MDVDTAFAAIPRLRSRPGQRLMARAVDQAVSVGGSLLVHAPTGIGKSLGYLVPMAAAGRRVTIATATKALQAQLVDRDLPRVAEAFGVTYALALGRANFYCKSRGDALFAATRLAATPAEEAALDLVEWAATSETGLRVDAPAGTRDDAWDLVSTSGEDCPGQRGCSFHAVCFAERARELAREADVVVTNHHLLLLELELRRLADAPGVMLPETGVIIVDEAHRLADTAAELFGATVRATRVGRAGAAVDTVVRATGRRSEWGRRLRARWDERTEALRPGPVLPASRAAQRLGDALAAIAREVAAAGYALAPLSAFDEELEGSLHAAKQRIAGLARDLVRLGEAIDPEPKLAPDLAVWVERGRSGDHVVRSALVEPGAALRGLLWDRKPPRRGRTRPQDPDPGADAPGADAPGAGPEADVEAGGDQGPEAGAGPGVRPVTVACSATLAVGGSLDAAAAWLGAGDPATLVQPSPFDFERNAMLYVPAEAPVPGGTGFAAAAERQVRRLVEASRGRALVLCTSWRGVESLSAALADLEYDLLVQGTDSAPRLAERFRDEVSSVLLATRTFFEGIDVPGESLSLLVLDRLPFPPPDDPLLAERGRRVERRGGSRFNEVWLPAAAVSLQQALGRLIRTEHDRGVMAVLDRRLADAPYGSFLRASLPPAPMTRSLDEVQRFFAADPAIPSPP
jgi:ATP-dependent DNA helicase DinG